MTSIYRLFNVLLLLKSLILFVNFRSIAGSNVLLDNRIYPDGNLIFVDNFNYFDLSKWSFDPNYEAHSDEFQLYTNSSENSYVENGILHIRPTFNYAEPSNRFRKNYHPIYSARISTRHAFSFQYGTVEIRAKVPVGDWLFPALWLMPSNSVYGIWPQSGEIDLMESRGNLNLRNENNEMVGLQQVSHTLHYGYKDRLDAWRTAHYKTTINYGTFGEYFHTYKFVWTPDNIIFYVDDVEIGNVSPSNNGFYQYGHFPTGKDYPNIWKNGTKMAPFDQKFYIIINLAVGGTHFFSDSYINEGGKPWKNNSPNPGWDFWTGRNQWLPTWNLNDDSTHFLIDSVHVWSVGEGESEGGGSL